MLRKAQRVLVVMHATPDGDSAGSGLALGMALERQGHRVDWVSWDGIPERLRFLPGSERVQTWAAVDLGHYDCIVAVDCGSASRLAGPEELWEPGRCLVNIDHHPGNPHFGNCNWVDKDASSTGEMIVRLFREAGWYPTLAEALCLYTAISTDTLSFRQVNTTLDTMETVFWLVGHSELDLQEANRLIWDSRPEAELKFLGWALSSIDRSPDGRWAWVGVPREKMDHFGVDDSGVDTVVHHLLSIDGVEVAFLVRESEQTGKVKVSWRGKPPWDVGRFAAEFGGGGHRYAAAAQLDASLDEAVAAVKSELGKSARA